MSRLTQLGYAFLISSFCSVVVAQNGSALGVPPWQQASLWPDRIIQNLSAAPANEIAINWRTDSNVASTIAQIAPATADARFDAVAATVVARTEPVYLNTAMVDGVVMAAPEIIAVLDMFLIKSDFSLANNPACFSPCYVNLTV